MMHTCSKHSYSGLYNSCPDCGIEIIKHKFNSWIKDQKDIDFKTIEIINENFWKLL